MILINLYVLFCTWYFFLLYLPYLCTIFFSEDTYFVLGHIAGKYVGSLNHEDKSIKKPGILDLFLHLLFL